jgi:hypothetical protein
LKYHTTTHDTDGDTSASEKEDQDFDLRNEFESPSSCNNRLQLLTDGSIGFADCFIQVKRANFIESTVEKGFKSVRITQHACDSNQTLYTLIP